MKTSSMNVVNGKKPWIHDRLCDYCIEQEIPGEFNTSKGPGTGCRHFRGGKTRADHRSNKGE